MERKTIRLSIFHCCTRMYKTTIKKVAYQIFQFKKFKITVTLLKIIILKKVIKYEN